MWTEGVRIFVVDAFASQPFGESGNGLNDRFKAKIIFKPAIQLECASSAVTSHRL